jgi:hypothetical protein
VIVACCGGVQEKYGPFTFEWAIEYVFDLEMTSLKVPCARALPYTLVPQ